MSLNLLSLTCLLHIQVEVSSGSQMCKSCWNESLGIQCIVLVVFEAVIQDRNTEWPRC